MSVAPPADTKEQLEDDPRMAPGRTFGGYVIIRAIGRGGMSSVFEAEHLTLKKRVAIKVLHPDLAASEPLRARFVREGQATSRIRHPNVLSVTDVGTQEGLPFLVMELLAGESLKQTLNAHETLDERTLANVLVPVIAGLQAAHEVGVLHRDLKPENIVLARETEGSPPVPKIIDFGVSKLLDASHSLTMDGAVLGTPHYMAPEIIQQRANVDGRVDQYALGVMMYECLTGRVPYDGSSLFELMSTIVSGVYVPPSLIRAELSMELERLVMKAMASDPDARYPSLLELGRDLIAFSSPRTQRAYGALFDFSGAHDPADEDLTSTGRIPLPKRVLEPVDPSGETRIVGGPTPMPSALAPTPISAPRIGEAPTSTPKRRAAALALVLLGLGLAGVSVYYLATRGDEHTDTDTSTEAREEASASAAGAPVEASREDMEATDAAPELVQSSTQDVHETAGGAQPESTATGARRHHRREGTTQGQSTTMTLDIRLER